MGNSRLFGITAGGQNERLLSADGVLQTAIQGTVDVTGQVTLSDTSVMDVNVVGPVTAFGEVRIAEPTPRVQVDAVYGIVATDTESIVDASPGTGTATASGSMFVCQTGTGVGAFATIRSRRLARYRPGQGLHCRYTALFTSPVANSLQLAGAFSATEYIGFGYQGTEFGVLRRAAGACAIVRLTISTGSGGAETITVTLNSVPFVVTSGGALSTTGLAERIAETIVATGWTSVVSPTSNGSTVTFIQQVPAVASGTYSMSSSGTAAGTFATIQAGVANIITGPDVWIPQASWNTDNMSGTGGASNPSGMLLDPTKLNVYGVALAYLGAGAIQFYVTTPEGSRQLVHIIEYPNSAILPNLKNPSLRIGWTSASLGSTTNLTVKGASASMMIEGKVVDLRDPVAPPLTAFTAGTTEYVALAIRVGSVFANTVNQRVIFPEIVSAATETNNRVVRMRIVINPTMTGTVNWQWVDSTTSCMEYAQPTTVAATGGRTIAYGTATYGSPAELDLKQLDVRIEPGDVLAICVVASGAADSFVGVNCNET